MYNLNRELRAGKFLSRLEPTVENVRQSCRAVSYSPQCTVKIDEARARDIDNISLENLKQSSHYMEVPIKFPDERSEVNFHIIIHLFNFAHGYRHSLHAVRQAGAWQTMKRGIEMLQQRSNAGFIKATVLANLSQDRVVEIFDLGIRDEHGNSTRCAPKELEPLVQMIVEVAHDSGKRLLALRMLDFATFVYAHCRHPQNNELSAAWLVQQLAKHFPAFDDRREWCNGEEVLFLKKAQLAVAELYQRFSAQNPAYFSFPDIDRFTVACDNVLPCVLRTLGVLILPSKLLFGIDSKQPLSAGWEEAELRATAITAAEMMIEHGKKKFWAKEIGDFLWTLGKDPHYRNVERHATPDTCFY